LTETIPDLATWELVLRILAAAVLGGLLGLEREISDQPAGFRTHILVSLGAALFTLVGAYGVDEFFNERAPGVGFDPTRVAAQVVTGIGFLGAGAIIRQGMNVRGLTTAASLWVTAAIGTAVGLGYWTGAVTVALVTLGALYGLRRVEPVLLAKLRKPTPDAD
jgi:putative Mg2+ transporter-C (MgtC) family protein